MTCLAAGIHHHIYSTPSSPLYEPILSRFSCRVALDSHIDVNTLASPLDPPPHFLIGNQTAVATSNEYGRRYVSYIIPVSRFSPHDLLILLHIRHEKQRVSEAPSPRCIEWSEGYRTSVRTCGTALQEPEDRNESYR